MEHGGFEKSVKRKKEKTVKGTKLYKLTDENGQTRNNTQWGEGMTHSGTGEGELCSEGWIHAYTHPLLAVLFNPIHADFETPRLWEARGTGESKSDGLKVGFQSITTIKEIPLPKITTIQRIAFTILVAKKVYKNAKWNEWADKWLSGENRAARAAAYARAANAAEAAYAAYAAAYAAYAAAYNAAYAAAYNAAYAAADAARAADAAADAARVAAYAARAAAEADVKINFVRIAQKVVKEF